MDFERFKAIAKSQGLLVGLVEGSGIPVPVKAAIRDLAEGFDQLKKEFEKYKEETATHIQNLEAMSRAAMDLNNQTSAALRDQTTLDDLNNGVDEQPIRGGEYSGWSLVGGIRLGRPAAIVNQFGAPMAKVLISQLSPDVQTDFDVFRLAVKRNPFGVLQAIVIDLTSTFG